MHDIVGSTFPAEYRSNIKLLLLLLAVYLLNIKLECMAFYNSARKGCIFIQIIRECSNFNPKPYILNFEDLKIHKLFFFLKPLWSSVMRSDIIQLEHKMSEIICFLTKTIYVQNVIAVG